MNEWNVNNVQQITLIILWFLVFTNFVRVSHIFWSVIKEIIWFLKFQFAWHHFKSYVSKTILYIEAYFYWSNFIESSWFVQLLNIQYSRQCWSVQKRTTLWEENWLNGRSTVSQSNMFHHLEQRYHIHSQGWLQCRVRLEWSRTSLCFQIGWIKRRHNHWISGRWSHSPSPQLSVEPGGGPSGTGSPEKQRRGNFTKVGY